MECPIKNHAVETGTYRGKQSTRDCCKEECAWWIPSLECCSIHALAINTYNNTLLYRGSFAKYVQDEE
jgi:hypothetical protein